MDSKDRAALRRAANGIKTVYYIGKEPVGDNLIEGIGQALKARELIKVGVQENSEITARQAAEELARVLGDQVVQVIGSRFVLYRRNPDINAYRIQS